MLYTLNFDYKSVETDLCVIGAKYGVVTSYTAFYNSLFKHHRHEIINVAVVDGDDANQRMWKEYFQLGNVATLGSTKETKQYDVIMQNAAVLDSLHMYTELIYAVYDKLTAGGILIVENVSSTYDESMYVDAMMPLQAHFSKMYLVHANTDKQHAQPNKQMLLVLVKSGAPPIFANKNKVTIVTPSIRPENLPLLKDSINFEYVNEWIIVYDGRIILEHPWVFENKHPKIIEVMYCDPNNGISGNPQRNFALDIIQDKYKESASSASSASTASNYIYFLDDDNLIHSHLYSLLDYIDDGHMYTFNMLVQQEKLYIFPGNRIQVKKIDSAMVLIDYKLCKDIRWNPYEYSADGMFISECYEKNKNKWIYVNNQLCTYNRIGISTY